MNMIYKETERHEIEALLPWHAAGTLSRRDADRVEQALAADRELARRYDLVRQELAETIHLRKGFWQFTQLIRPIEVGSASRHRDRCNRGPRR
jgi:hypothetical protein